MNNIVVEGTLETPKIEFDLLKGYLLIEGRSIPENSSEFFQPLIDALITFSETSASNIEVDFKLEYFNTSSSKCILDVLKLLQEISSNNNDVKINWYYDEDDDEILEIGEDYSHIVSVPFNLISIPN